MHADHAVSNAEARVSKAAHAAKVDREAIVRAALLTVRQLQDYVAGSLGWLATLSGKSDGVPPISLPAAPAARPKHRWGAVVPAAEEEFRSPRAPVDGTPTRVRPTSLSRSAELPPVPSALPATGSCTGSYSPRRPSCAATSINAHASARRAHTSRPAMDSEVLLGPQPHPPGRPHPPGHPQTYKSFADAAASSFAASSFSGSSFSQVLEQGERERSEYADDAVALARDRVKEQVMSIDDAPATSQPTSLLPKAPAYSALTPRMGASRPWIHP